MKELIIGLVIGLTMGILATAIVCGRLDKWEQKREAQRKMKERAGR